MRKLSVLSVAVALAVSTSAFAEIGVHNGGIEHIASSTNANQSITQTKSGSFKPTSRSSVQRVAAKSAVSGIQPDECTAAEFASHSGSDLIEYLENAHTIGNANQLGYDCFRVLFEDTSESSTIFSSANITTVADSLVADLTAGDVDIELMFGKLMYFRTMYFNYAIGDTRPFTMPDESTIKAGLDLIFASNDGSTTDVKSNAFLTEANHTMTSYFITKDFLNETGGDARVAGFVDMMDAFTNVLVNSKELHVKDDEPESYALYNLATSATQSLDRLITALKTDPNVFDHPTLPGILAEYTWNVSINDPVPSNAASVLTYLFQGDTISAETVAAVQSVIDNTDKFTMPHLRMLSGIVTFDVDCSVFGRDAALCSNDELLAEMKEFALPNVWTFGDITFETKMTEERTKHVYESLRATRSQFFRDTGVTEAVDNDPNANATFVIYGSPSDYRTFQGFLYNLDSNNGGIYIEQDGTLFTYDRDDSDMFVMEELARHEYSHYLISRYLVNGMWGETDTYADDRMVWFDEGLANHFTSATQASGTGPLRTMIDMKDQTSTTRSISEVTSTSYSDNWMYPYSSLLFNYLDSIDSDVISALSAALVSDDISEFDSIVDGLSSHNAGFQTYVSDISSESWEAPWFAYKSGAELEEDGTANIQSTLADAFSTTVTCSEINEENFSCTFSADVSGDVATQIDVTNSTLNAGILLALQSGPNNIETMTCHPTEIGVSAECVGSLRPDSIPYENEETDSDGDGYNDDVDAFPNDPTEWLDTDGDGTGDNADAFPNDATETTDTDGDGVGNNSDVFPNDATEWEDTDSDGYGDNSDAFPTDSTEWLDTDGDGHGDNSDYYPNDASKWEEETTTVVTPTPTPDTAKSSSGGGSFGIFSGLFLLIIGAARAIKK